MLGNPDYDAEDTGKGVGTIAAAPIESSTRNGRELFASLSQTGAEIASIRGLFEGRFEGAAHLLAGKDATRGALHRSAGDVRYLHLATHGWFAPETVKSLLDPAPIRDGEQPGLLMTAERRVTGLAPITLCGLALAGANRGTDSLGRVSGIMTAEELATLDLACCELAVLSACETNVGIRRAGQGIQSLQTALHIAGARSAITSLWKVDDAATRKLMELFYTGLWVERLPVAEALWRAKTIMRNAGHPVRDWAAWVLSGGAGRP